MLMREQNIKFKPQIQVTAECIVNDYDMCAILGNLLDNAIEACEKIDNHNTRFMA